TGENLVQQRVVLHHGGWRQAVRRRVVHPRLDQRRTDSSHRQVAEARQEVLVQVVPVARAGGYLQVRRRRPLAVLDVGGEGDPARRGGGPVPAGGVDLPFGGGLLGLPS